VNIQAIVDKLIGYSASAVAILGSIQNEMGASHDQHAIYVAAVIGFIHHYRPVLEAMAKAMAANKEGQPAK
jgi:hypothetical protein